MRGLLGTIGVFALAFIGMVAFWFGAFWLAQATGFNKQVTPEYGFSSGIGPMILAAFGYGTLVAGVWHGVNCHEGGCWRIGRHRVDGTPWCNVHHEKARGTGDS